MGKNVIVKYCFASFPRDPHRRPWQINVGVDNRQDNLPSLTLGYTIKRLCANGPAQRRSHQASWYWLYLSVDVSTR